MPGQEHCPLVHCSEQLSLEEWREEVKSTPGYILTLLPWVGAPFWEAEKSVPSWRSVFP